MERKEAKKEKQKCNCNQQKSGKESESMAYRLKCAKTANGLSHFVMYGDVQKDKTLL